jgi:hypothetical protein
VGLLRVVLVRRRRDLFVRGLLCDCKRFVTVAMPLLAVLALLSPEKAVAGPPESPSGATKLDTVADGLRQYQQHKADDKRVEWLKRLALSKDPRVKAALEAALSDSSDVVAEVAVELLADHYDGYRIILLPPLRVIIRPPTPPPSGPPET